MSEQVPAPLRPEPQQKPRSYQRNRHQHHVSSRRANEEIVNLRLILVSGKTKDYKFAMSESAGEIAQFVFENWPSEWADESVSSAEILRLIYQGRFLHGNVTLAALGLPPSKTTVMHLVPRESLPEPNSQDEEKKKKARSSRCCSSCSLL